MYNERGTSTSLGSEKELLVELVPKYKNVIENDEKTDAFMWKEKEACRAELAGQFNGQG